MNMRRSDIEIQGVKIEFEDYDYRMPIKFGGSVVSKVTLLNVEVEVRSRGNLEATGFGSIPLGNVWSFPSKRLSYDETLLAMKLLAEEIAALTKAHRRIAHPIDINWELEPRYFEAADQLTRKLRLPESIPKLCTLVVASPFDAALHDAFGKACGINCYHGYGPAHMTNDLSCYLGSPFRSEYPAQYVSAHGKPLLPIYHLVGALDPITDSDLEQPVNDGHPETLSEWILAEGLTNFKIKLNGDNLEWDLNRVIAVDCAVSRAEEKRGVDYWHYSLDFNEKCPDVEYLLDFLRSLEARSSRAFDRVEYIEQPTARDLRNLSGGMHEAAKIKPVVIDESLVDYESMLLARELGYSGVALKACKGQTNSLLMAAAAQKFGMFLCVQDLTCPGASLLQSVGLAAHIPPVRAIETNSRQYVPAANESWKELFPAVFQIKDGQIGTESLDGLGLGAVPLNGVSIEQNRM